MGKVVKLAAKPTAVKEVVEAAERLLDRCKSGEVRGFAVAMVKQSAPYTSSSSAFEVDNVLTHKLLVSACEELRHEFKHALRGG